jgi:hypothetical protein
MVDVVPTPPPTPAPFCSQVAVSGSSIYQALVGTWTLDTNSSHQCADSSGRPAYHRYNHGSNPTDFYLAYVGGKAWNIGGSPCPTQNYNYVSSGAETPYDINQTWNRYNGTKWVAAPDMAVKCTEAAPTPPPTPSPYNESLYTVSQATGVPVAELCSKYQLKNCSFISVLTAVEIPNSAPSSPTPAPGPPTPPAPAAPTPAPPGPAPPTPTPGGQCTGCIGGSHGECKAASNVCFPATAGACPAGTTHC